MNFAYNDTFPYPFVDEIFPDEDGVGYALRLAQANALSFHQLATFLASPGHCYLPYCSAPALGFMFGGTPEFIARALVRRHFEAGITVADFAEHRFSRPKHVRQSRPQICPFCLLERGHARASWSITMMCCCTEHKVCLIDQCSCGRPISWRRRSLLVCECGRSLGDATPVHPATRGALAICSQIEYLLGPAHFRLQSSLDSDLAIFDDVSVDTFLRVVWALGHSTCQSRRGTQHILHAIPTPSEAMLTADEAYNRIKHLLSRRNVASLHRWTHQLISIHEEAVTLPDQRLLSSILAKITPRPPVARRIDRNGPVQSSLFEE
ncbi:TniQ family protein [Paraburkholderia caledonica]|uniref:TniQ family protein n=1 Tax=Paraburkholderia caledonica TaxID=134536 RepID=UPI0015C60B27